MPEFRYTMPGRWWKGNTHIHSTASDGGKTFGELAELYHNAGYDFLFRTDHWVASDTGSDTEPYPILWLDGIELDGVEFDRRRLPCGRAWVIPGASARHGAPTGDGSCPRPGWLLILAHPLWMGNTFEDAQRWQFDGVEVYNHVCRWLNGKGDGSAYWNVMLSSDANTLSFSVDDAHITPEHPGWNGGWVMVNARECTPEAILAALKAGNFYSTCGPLFESIEFDGSQVRIQCSPVQVARLVGPGWHGSRIGSFNGGLLTGAAFEIPTAWQYAYLEIEDGHGRRAWTNPLIIAG